MAINSSDAARALAQLPRSLKPFVCEVCGKPFEARRSARYCSNRCRQKKKYQRLKDQTSTAPPGRSTT